MSDSSVKNEAGYPVASWNEDAEPGEVCCKEMESRRSKEPGETIRTCGRTAVKAVVNEVGGRLPFCSYHWAR